MKLKRKIQTVLLLLIIGCFAVFTSACSYTKVEKKLREKIDSEYTSEPATDILNQVNQDDIIYFQVGQTIPGYYSYTDDAGMVIEAGVKGINYKINSVNIVDSASSYGIALDAPIAENIDFFGANSNNSLILVDLTAYLDSETESVEKWGMDFFADFGWSGEFCEFNQIFPDSCNPTIVFFSDHIIDGDINPLTQEEMKQSSDYNVFRSSIDAQHPLNFQIGIVASNDLISEKNVFLSEFYAIPPSDNPIYKIDLLGRYSK